MRRQIEFWRLLGGQASVDTTYSGLLFAVYISYRLTCIWIGDDEMMIIGSGQEKTPR